MADLTPSERLQPCLLDRLTDDEPDKGVESRDKRVFTLRQVREAVLRDLSWLLNTAQRFTGDAVATTPNVASSVVNFGVPDVCGATLSGLSLPAVERAVAEAVLRFEPRIMAASLVVRAVADADSMGRTALVFEIGGDLWAQPIPEPLHLRTTVDLESGQCSVQEDDRR